MSFDHLKKQRFLVFKMSSNFQAMTIIKWVASKNILLSRGQVVRSPPRLRCILSNIKMKSLLLRNNIKGLGIFPRPTLVTKKITSHFLYPA